MSLQSEQFVLHTLAQNLEIKILHQNILLTIHSYQVGLAFFFTRTSIIVVFEGSIAKRRLSFVIESVQIQNEDDRFLYCAFAMAFICNVLKLTSTSNRQANRCYTRVCVVINFVFEQYIRWRIDFQALVCDDVRSYGLKQVWNCFHKSFEFP